MRILILLFFTLSSFAQNNDQRLAYQYYINGDYEKAVILYEEINKKSFSLNTYNPFFTSSSVAQIFFFDIAKHEIRCIIEITKFY